VLSTGRIGKDAKIRSTRDGKLCAAFPVAVDAKADGEAPATWVRVALFGDTVSALAPRLIKARTIISWRPCGSAMHGRGGASNLNETVTTSMRQDPDLNVCRRGLDA
jgi:hypothetical protein